MNLTRNRIQVTVPAVALQSGGLIILFAFVHLISDAVTSMISALLPTIQNTFALTETMLALLIATLAALMCGPLLYVLAHPRPALLAFLDGFVLVAISGLVLLEVMPDTLLGGGPASLGFLLLGALGPSLLEHQLQHARRAHVAALVLAMVGLVLHSVADGTALAPQPGLGDEPNLALALAIAVHSVPVGLMVWWLLYPVFGALFPALAIGGMCLGTITGYAFAGTVGGWLGATGWAWLQALVAGSILHVVFGRPHLGDTSAHRIARPPFEGLGNLSALGALLILETLHPAGHQGHPGMLDRLLDLSRMLAPALVQGKSRWQPVRWSELPGFGADTLHDAWNAWLRSCERPSPQHAALVTPDPRTTHEPHSAAGTSGVRRRHPARQPGGLRP